ncbi:glycosyltransferase family 10 domain-containing protein [Anabaena lutea]|uniref:Fucosyltransferase C-terminal domain-containing protein n=1 Tax=Anabaena lutea FACHB-196 TaxID=2692881 RepID=A0ABR8FL45_9NOST|nr:glycosyltransferase family 10 [Anabaena lutea]MBD2570585.1 hypothetical protein [Anabaena lutea FACHB-196]
MRIKVTVGYPNWIGIRQTPNSQGIWGDCEFIINQECDSCDAWVVLQSSKGLLKQETTLCPSENLILITREPPEMMSWATNYIKQFNVVVTCHSDIKHHNKIISQHGQTWHLGDSHSFDKLVNIEPPQKQKLLSVICSNKTFTSGHRARLKLLEALKNHFKELEFFGRPIRPIEDKWDAIFPYKYNIVLENGSVPHYWTEKLTDAYLGYALPLYYGCPNITDYFSPDAFLPIDTERIDWTIHTIEQAINNNLYEKSLPAIIEARHQVLYRYNLFPMLAELCSQLTGSSKQKITLRPDFEFKTESKISLLAKTNQVLRSVVRNFIKK